MQDNLESAKEALRQVNQVILGKEKAVKEVMLAFLADIFYWRIYPEWEKPRWHYAFPG